MNNMDMLDLIGNVKDSYIEQAQRHRQPQKPVTKSRSPWKIILIAAAMAMLLTGCAYAVMKLQDLKMGEYVTPIPMEQTVLTTAEESVIAEDTVTVQKETTAPEVWDVISMQGFAGSPGYLASKEWHEFVSTYDPDLEILKKSAEENFITPEAYTYYGCYSQEMVDKAEEICQKYNLEPLGKMWIVADIPQIFRAIGIDDIRSESKKDSFRFLESYCYSDGTFQLAGDLNMEERNTTVYFTMRNVMKGTFDYVYMIVNDPETFNQWHYTMKNGTEILLAVRGEEGLIFADQDQFFASVLLSNCGMTGDQEGDRKTMEEIAESFCFSYHPSKADTTILDEAQRAREKMWE